MKVRDINENNIYCKILIMLILYSIMKLIRKKYTKLLESEKADLYILLKRELDKEEYETTVSDYLKTCGSITEFLQTLESSEMPYITGDSKIIALRNNNGDEKK